MSGKYIIDYGPVKTIECSCASFGLYSQINTMYYSDKVLMFQILDVDDAIINFAMRNYLDYINVPILATLTAPRLKKYYTSKDVAVLCIDQISEYKTKITYECIKSNIDIICNNSNIVRALKINPFLNIREIINQYSDLI